MPDASDHALVSVSTSVTTSMSSGARPSASAAICAATVACPCPAGVETVFTVTAPDGSIEIVQVPSPPDRPPARARSSGVWASVT